MPVAPDDGEAGATLLLARDAWRPGQSHRVTEIQDVIFRRAHDGGEARIKIYTTDAGAPKGEALVSFFRPESVDLAVSVLDESCLRAADGKTTPVMRVSKAEWSGKKEAGAEGAPKADQKKKEPRTEKDKKNAQKRFAKLNE